MHEIQLIAVKLLQIILVALLIPPIALLIIAAFNERMRRVLLWILAPLALLALIAYVTLAPRGMNSTEDWSRVGVALQNGLRTGLPLLMILAVIGIVAYLFGPAIRILIENYVQYYTRQEYLTAMLKWVEPQVVTAVKMEGRVLPDIPANNQMLNLRIIGELGSGKSMLMRSTLHQLVLQASSDKYRALPVWIDLDERLLAADGLDFQRLELVLPVHTRFLDWLLKREGQAKRLIFLVDSSIQNYGMTFAAFGGVSGTLHTAEKLAKLIRSFAPCPFIVAMPPGIQDGSFIHLVESEQRLESLSEKGILAGVQALMGDPASPLEELLKSNSGIWNQLACRPAFLSWLAKFYKKNKRLPQNVRELFRETVYPQKIPAAQVEMGLIGLVNQAAKTGEYWGNLLTLEESLRSASTNKSGLKPQDNLGMVVAMETQKSGLLRLLPGDELKSKQPRIGFAHPIFLAYATALAWYANQPAALALLERFQGINTALSMDGPADAFQTDPILADALVFFNNIETDPQRLEQALAALVEKDSAGESGQRFSSFLAAHCLLVMPEANRPARLVEQGTGRIIEEMAYDPDAAGLARLLLDPMEEPARLLIYANTLLKMDEARLEHTLRRVSEWNAPGALTGENELRAMLWRGSDDLCRAVGEVWAACEPKQALLLFQELYEQGPAERREQAIRLLGHLPHEAVSSYLHTLLGIEKNPTLRIAILRSLTGSGVDITFTLLDVIARPYEDDSVRIYATEQLANSSSPEIETGGVVREVVRISRMLMPEKARIAIQRLMDRLREHIPADTSRWEEVINPYVVGRPVTDPRLFFGRAALVRDLCIAVDNATPVLLTGEHGSGKTSLFYHLAAILEKEARQGVPVRTVLLDIQGLQPHEFFETAIRTIIEGLRDPNLVADPNVPRPYNDQRFSSDLDHLLEYQQTNLGNESRLVLFIDEADVFLSYPQVMHTALRRVFTGASARGLVVILAGTDPLRRWQNPEPPFYSNFLHLPIPLLSHQEAVQLITAPVAGSFQYEPEAVERIYTAAQGRPDEIQVSCHRLVSRLLAQGERIITASIVIECQQGPSPRAELLAQAESTLSQMMDWLESHPEAPAPHIEEQVKQAWSELQKAMLQQVVRLRKGKV